MKLHIPILPFGGVYVCVPEEKSYVDINGERTHPHDPWQYIQDFLDEEGA